jgi:hypothetical protein
LGGVGRVPGQGGTATLRDWRRPVPGEEAKR